MDNHEAGNSSEGEHSVGATDPALDSSDLSFNFGHMFVGCTAVELRKPWPEWLKLNMMSIARTVLLCLSMISIGTPLVLLLSCLFALVGVLPFNDPRLGPNIWSAVLMSDLVIGQSWRCLMATSISSRELMDEIGRAHV